MDYLEIKGINVWRYIGFMLFNIIIRVRAIRIELRRLYDCVHLIGRIQVFLSYF